MIREKGGKENGKRKGEGGKRKRERDNGKTGRGEGKRERENSTSLYQWFAENDTVRNFRTISHRLGVTSTISIKF